MAINKWISLDVAFVLALFFFLYEAEGHRPLPDDCATFDVTKFGAKGDGKATYADTGESLNALGIVQAWQKACHNKQPSKVVIPKGTFVVAQVVLEGPCESHVTVELEGNIIPDPDRTQFPNNELILFQNVDGVTFTGSGTIDVYREPRKSLDPEREIDFFSLMPSIKLISVKNAVVEGITSMNPSAFHILVAECHNITIRNMNLDAAFLAPNSDSNGVYISASSLVSVSNCFIRTGDDCVTIAPGSSDVSVTGVTCSDGQGISIGAQAYTAALDVKGVVVKNCTFKGTTFGARLFPRPGATPSQVSNVVFEDLVMEGVQNPIFISQEFHHIPNKFVQPKIVDVHFKNIRGTATTNNVISFSCNPLFPCEGIEVADIDLNVIGNALNPIGKVFGLLANCLNAKVVFGGRHHGLSCFPLNN